MSSSFKFVEMSTFIWFSQCLSMTKDSNMWNLFIFLKNYFQKNWTGHLLDWSLDRHRSLPIGLVRFWRYLPLVRHLRRCCSVRYAWKRVVSGTWIFSFFKKTKFLWPLLRAIPCLADRRGGSSAKFEEFFPLSRSLTAVCYWKSAVLQQVPVGPLC